MTTTGQANRAIRLQVIVASNRPGGNGRPVGEWVAARAAEHGAFEVRLVDLAAVRLPFLDEPELPSTGDYRHRHTKEWSATVAAAEAFVLVMPMYNGGYGAVLKNALDFLYAEWHGKPVALVSYSAGATGGAPAAKMIRPVLRRLALRVTAAATAIPHVGTLIAPDGGLSAPAALAASLAAQLDELAAAHREPGPGPAA
ncbi:NADPH-dependent FMN reductase [Streptomyces hoynatensis]|uniref:NADPH-dependent oxidoreductase n=1 Tax=Streptomyces hoynatensis TaxID=1141874 RepID=A0A3A9YUR4_9ACTN|nr:NAD(P)H-dependent oxidoreductase [Streptomyces hoynatensis]RKN39725.1 NADPH-dependent oxidoreductase [Streptomyces hoynatensis]